MKARVRPHARFATFSILPIFAAFAALAAMLVSAPEAVAVGGAVGATCDPEAEIRFAMYGDSLCDGSIEPCDVLDAEPDFACLNRCNSGYATNRLADAADPLSAVVPLLLDDLASGLLAAEDIEYVVIATGANDVRPGVWSATNDYDLPLRQAVSAVADAGMTPVLTVTHPQYETADSGFPECTLFRRNVTRIEAVMIPIIQAIAAETVPSPPVLNLYETFGAFSEAARCPGAFDDPDGMYRDHVHMTFGKGNQQLTGIYRRALRVLRTTTCPAEAPVCEIEASQLVFRTGDVLGARRLRFANRTAAIRNVRAVVELRFEQALVKRPIDIGPIALAIGWEFETSANLLPISETLPRGQWSLRCALADWSTGALHSVNESAFTIE